MKYLITGGAGFIGSYFVKSLLNKNNNILIVDKLNYAVNKVLLKEMLDHENIKLDQIDICNKQKIMESISTFQPNRIVHFAAETHVDRSILNPDDFIYTNIIGTYNLLQASLEFYMKLDNLEKEKFRFHHVSTDEVYGDLSLIKENEINIADDKKPFSEKNAYKPNSPYSASKASSDHLVRSWYSTYGLPITISNCSNNYGPYQFEEKLIPKIILNAFNCFDIPIYGDGTNVRDWLYVGDHIKAIQVILDRGKVSQTYNIGSRFEISNMKIVSYILKILDTKYPIRANSNNKNNYNSYKELICFVEDRKGHDRRYAIDPKKIEKELQWSPIEDFETGINKTIEFYYKNFMRK